MYRLFFIAFPILFIGSFSVSAQLDSVSRKILTGSIVDDSPGFGIPSVHLWNESTRMGTVSGTSGEFRIKAKEKLENPGFPLPWAPEIPA